jgi:hypothetical protein
VKLASLATLADHEITRGFDLRAANERRATAETLAYLAEMDARRLYLPAGYPSMYQYCLQRMGWSEDEAYRRIRVARAIRAYPAILAALEDGRLHLSAVSLLAPYLEREGAEALLAAAAHRSKAGIERLIAERFPQPDLPVRVQAVGPAANPSVVQPAELVPERVEPMAQAVSGAASTDHVPACDAELVPGRVQRPEGPRMAGPLANRPRVLPTSPGRVAIQVTVAERTHDKLRYAQALLGHAVPSGDLAEVLDRALDALIERLERAKFGVGSRSRRGGSRDPRHIPAAVRRAVLERDGGCCTFTGPDGHRCGERTRLEYDHVRPLARGGEASVENLRLRCDAHNQHEADRVYGEPFMRGKRTVRPRGLRRHAEPPLRARPLSPQEHAASRVAAAEARAKLDAMLAAPA